MAARKNSPKVVQEAATALSAAIRQSQQAIEQILALEEPERRACLRLLRETGIARSWATVAQQLLDAADPLNPHRQAEHALKLLKNARRMDQALRRELVKNR